MPISEKRNHESGKARVKPRISLNKLGEYTAERRPSRRHRIIHNQKYPKGFIGPYYGPIRDGLVRYIAGGENNVEPLNEALRRLENQASRSSWRENRFKSSLDAVTSFRTEFNEVLEQDGLYAVPVRKSDPSDIWIKGVRVTIRPDLLIFGRDGRGSDIAGVVKLYFSKNHPLTRVSGKYITTLLQRYVEEQIADEEVITSRKRCIALDVFTGERYTAPRAYKRRRKDLAAACVEIRSMWPKI